MNRREFLSAAALAAPAVFAGAGKDVSARPLKVCIFSDLRSEEHNV